MPNLLRRIALVLTVVFVSRFVSPMPASCQSSRQEIIDHFDTGQQALKSGEFTLAVEEFKKVVTLDPSLVEAEVNLGLAYHSLGEYDLGVRHIAKGLRQRPNLIGPNLIVGTDYLKLGAPEKAAPYLQQVLKLDPSSGEARRALATCYVGQGDFRSAGKEYRRISELNPDKPAAWFNLGHDYLQLSAHLAYRGARLYRDSGWGNRFLGDLLFQRSRWDDAAQEYRKALEVDPRQPGLHTALGQAYLHAGKFDKAAAEFQQELVLDSQTEIAWLGLAEEHLAKGEGAEALEAVGRVWRISPEFLALQREFPTVELSQEAARALVEKLQGLPESAASHFLLAGLYGPAGGAPEAEANWKSLQDKLSAWQESPAARVHGEPCHAHQFAACSHSLRARKNPTDSQRLSLGRAEIALHHYELATDVLADVRGVTNANAEASYWLALSYHALGAESYEQLEESFPDSWRNHQLRAEGFAYRDDLPNALREFQVALQSQPDSAELHEAIGEIFLDNRSDDDARKELETALKLDPSRTRALCLLGRLYVHERENEKAVGYLQKALQLQPDFVEASSLLGTAYLRIGQFASAVPRLQQAAALDLFGNVHYQLYLAYRRLGQSQLAEKALSRSKELRRSSLEHAERVMMGSKPADEDQ